MKKLVFVRKLRLNYRDFFSLGVWVCLTLCVYFVNFDKLICSFLSFLDWNLAKREPIRCKSPTESDTHHISKIWENCEALNSEALKQDNIFKLCTFILIFNLMYKNWNRLLKKNKLREGLQRFEINESHKNWEVNGKSFN